MSHARSAVLLVAAFCLCAPAMHAGLITFAATGVTANSSTLSGDIIIDTTAGTVQSLSLTMTGTFNFSVSSIGSFTGPLGSYYLIAGDTAGSDPTVNIVLPVSTLVGYTGGVICNNGANCPSAQSVAYRTNSVDGSAFSSGSLTPVPEPSTILLTLAGGAVLLAARRRAHSNS